MKITTSFKCGKYFGFSVCVALEGEYLPEHCSDMYCGENLPKESLPLLQLAVLLPCEEYEDRCLSLYGTRFIVSVLGVTLKTECFSVIGNFMYKRQYFKK